VAQPLPLQYPEVAWLGRSTYCNPYFGFRLSLPAELKSEPLHLPVQSHGRHMLLALHLQRLDRNADLFLSTFEDGAENPARLAAKARVQQARQAGFLTTGPNTVSVRDHQFYRLRILADTEGPGSESSYFFAVRGYVVQAAIFSHADDLAASLGAVLEQLEFLEPGNSACTGSAPNAVPNDAPIAAPSATALPPPAPRLYYGPALPTGLVEATLRSAPGSSVPAGEFSRDTFADAALGVRVVLPRGWQPLPADEADRVTELMRDPIDDPGVTDRRRALFRACSRVLFAAADPATELTPDVHPGLAVVAMPQGCVPDLVPPATPGRQRPEGHPSARTRQAPTPGDLADAGDFAAVLVRSLGVPLLTRASLHAGAQGHLAFTLDGTLPSQIPGEKLSRRWSLRVSATASGPWLILVYSVTPTPALQRDLDARIAIATPEAASAK
jgi:hypothetical protein